MHSAIEQPRFWMWTRRKLNGRPLLDSMSPPITAPSSYHESWEEQAFAEDSAGHLGGCVWPPRSYSCSFCGREFRSAQALGGHMNVHRRDRARLKQSSSSGSDNHEADHHHHHQIPHVSTPGILLGSNYSPHVSTLVNSRNPNPNPSLETVASALSPSRVSAACLEEHCEEQHLVSPSYPASIIEEYRKEYLLSNPKILTGAVPASYRPFSVLELRLGRENWKPKEVGFRGPIGDDEETTSRKRKRDDTTFALFMKPSHGERQLLSAEVIKIKPNTAAEELDLELRLGDPPKVK